MIAPDVVERTLATALARGGDFAEVFAEDRQNVTARLDDGRVEELVSGRSRGAGVRVVRGESTGFAHTADLSEVGLAAAAEAAAAASTEAGEPVRVAPLAAGCAPAPTVAVLPETVAKDAKVALLLRANAAAREQSGAIRQVSASYADGRRRVLVANSDGVFAEDDQVRQRRGDRRHPRAGAQRHAHPVTVDVGSDGRPG